MRERRANERRKISEKYIYLKAYYEIENYEKRNTHSYSALQHYLKVILSYEDLKEEN